VQHLNIAVQHALGDRTRSASQVLCGTKLGSLIADARQTLLSPKNGENIEDAWRCGAPDERCPQGLGNFAKLAFGLFRKDADSSFDVRKGPIADILQYGKNFRKQLACILVKQLCSFLVDRQWALCEKKARTINEFHESLGALFQAGKGLQKLVFPRLVECVEKRSPTVEIWQCADQHVEQFRIVHLPHTGVVVSSTKQVEIGDALEITVTDGSLPAVAGNGTPDQKPEYTTARSKETRPRPKARPNQPSGMAPLL